MIASFWSPSLATRRANTLQIRHKRWHRASFRVSLVDAHPELSTDLADLRVENPICCLVVGIFLIATVVRVSEVSDRKHL